MKFTHLNLVGFTTIYLPIVGASRSDRYTLAAADGLAAPEADVSIANTLYQGGIYQGRRPQNKYLSLRVGLNKKWGISDMTVEQLREELYGLLSPSDSDIVKIEVVNRDAPGDGVIATIDGVCAGVEPALFSKDPEAIIKIPCLSPYLKSPDQQSVGGLSTSAPEITNVGNVRTGFLMTILFTEDVSGFVLFNVISGKQLEIAYDFTAGQGLTIDTRSGSKTLILNSEFGGDGDISLLGYMSENSSWLDLGRGLNRFEIYNQDYEMMGESFTWVGFWYHPTYWGV